MDGMLNNNERGLLKAIRAVNFESRQKMITDPSLSLTDLTEDLSYWESCGVFTCEQFLLRRAEIFVWIDQWKARRAELDYDIRHENDEWTPDDELFLEVPFARPEFRENC